MFTFPGLEALRSQFASSLDTRISDIDRHRRAASTASSASERCRALESACSVLHQIAGTAGVLGFDAVGQAARACENALIAYLDGPDAASATCPTVTLQDLERFVLETRETLPR